MSEQLAIEFLKRMDAEHAEEIKSLDTSMKVLLRRKEELQTNRAKIAGILASDIPEIPEISKPKIDKYEYTVKCTSCGNEGANNVGKHGDKFILKCIECGNEFLATESQMQIPVDKPEYKSRNGGKKKNGIPQVDWDLGGTARVTKFIEDYLRVKPEGVLYLTIRDHCECNTGLITYAVNKLLVPPTRYELYKDESTNRKVKGIRVIQEDKK